MRNISKWKIKNETINLQEKALDQIYNSTFNIFSIQLSVELF